MCWLADIPADGLDPEPSLAGILERRTKARDRALGRTSLASFEATASREATHLAGARWITELSLATYSAL